MNCAFLFFSKKPMPLILNGLLFYTCDKRQQASVSLMQRKLMGQFALHEHKTFPFSCDLIHTFLCHTFQVLVLRVLPLPNSSFTISNPVLHQSNIQFYYWPINSRSCTSFRVCGLTNYVLFLFIIKLEFLIFISKGAKLAIISLRKQ